jgi:predicted RNA-binding protein with PIN domain
MGEGQMPWMIDGHNLIGRIRGLDLSDPEDESRLVAMLVAYCGRVRKPATVYFDRRAAGIPNPPARGGVTVRFIATPRTADDAMRSHLQRLGKQAGNWTVVSSDAEVQRAARHAGARVQTSASFAQELESAPRVPEAEKPGEDIPQDEIQELLRAFQSRPKSRRP